jgi:hypothetical protein
MQFRKCRRSPAGGVSTEVRGRILRITTRLRAMGPSEVTYWAVDWGFEDGFLLPS